MNLSLSWCVRSASKISLTPSPGRPKTVSTPQSINRSIITSDVVFPIMLVPGNAFPQASSRSLVGPGQIGDVHAQGRRQVDLVILLIHEDLANLFRHGELAE